jgi:hypothetical protein
MGYSLCLFDPPRFYGGWYYLAVVIKLPVIASTVPLIGSEFVAGLSAPMDLVARYSTIGKGSPIPIPSGCLFLSRQIGDISPY